MARTKNNPGTSPVGALTAVVKIVPRQAELPAATIVLEATDSTPHEALVQVPPGDSTKPALDEATGAKLLNCSVSVEAPVVQPEVMHENVISTSAPAVNCESTPP